jgi:hypothetical protein
MFLNTVFFLQKNKKRRERSGGLNNELKVPPPRDKKIAYRVGHLGGKKEKGKRKRGCERKRKKVEITELWNTKKSCSGSETF